MPEGASSSRNFPLTSGYGFADYLLYVDGKAAGIIEAKKEGVTLTAWKSRPRNTAKASVKTSPPYTGPCHFSIKARASKRDSPTASIPNRAAARYSASIDPRACRLGREHRSEAPRSRAARPWPQKRTTTLRARSEHTATRSVPPASGPRKSPPSANLEKSLAQDRPRALIQMATGSGKTFTAVNFIYRLIKFAGARRVLFLVDRGNLGDQTLKEFQQYVTPDNNCKFTEELQRPAPAAQHARHHRRVCITTIQRLYSMLQGEELVAEDDEEASVYEPRDGSSRQPRARRLQPDHPDRDLRHHRHRRMPPLHLQPLAAGAGILRRLPHRPHRHALQADLRLLQPEPRHGIRPRAGRGRRRERRLRRLPHPHRDHRSAAPRSRQASTSTSATATRAQSPLGAARRGPRLRSRPARPRRRRPGPDPHRRPHLPGQALHRNLSRPHRGAQDAHLRQGRHPRRGHRRDRPRGVRQGQRLRPEDHLPHHRREAQGPDQDLPQQLPSRASPSPWT